MDKRRQIEEPNSKRRIIGNIENTYTGGSQQKFFMYPQGWMELLFLFYIHYIYNLFAQKPSAHSHVYRIDGVNE